MTNRLALIIFVLVLGGLLLDGFVLHTGAVVFLAKKFADLSEWIAFWR